MRETSFSPEIRMAALKRMQNGECVVAIAHELKLSRTTLYRWKKRFQTAGTNALFSGAGRPRKSLPFLKKEDGAIEAQYARRRIGELERSIARQQAELQFYRDSLSATET